ncbi:proton channel OTOP3-like [Genypterus blacodes]|uniref:proton channel OTOP3-like n=1 Tax=Genypterus blacodes TaxID=154954 RepID=UPI003F7582CC
MNPDPGTAGISEQDETRNGSDHATEEQPELDPLLLWVPSGRRLISGLLGLNVVLLGTALVAGQAFNPLGLKHQEPQVFLLLLMGFSLVWMLWYLLWARKQPGICPHKDHHAGGITVTLVLLLFAAFSLLLFIFRVGYLLSMRACKPLSKVLSPFFEAPFLGLQSYLLWAHSKDCIHRHKVITRSGLMLILSADLLLWLNAVTEDTIHQEIELEREGGTELSHKNSTENIGMTNSTFCQCSGSPLCLIFRKGLEVLYPFNMEYYLMAGCMIYVMWKNVGRRMSPASHPHGAQKLSLRIVYKGGVFFGLLFGVLALVAGVTIFILYQVWVSLPQYRITAFLVFYGYHLAIMPVMSLCSLVGLLVHRLDRRAQEGGHNPTRSLDVILLVGAALGQLALSYFSLVAALAVGTGWPLGELDLSYSLLSLLELVAQNIFIIEGLHRHPSLHAKKKERQRSSIFLLKKKVAVQKEDEGKTDTSLMEADMTAPTAGQESHRENSWAKTVIQEICAFLILSNIMLWIIPAFGVHPQFENGLGKEFFGFSAWFVLVNLGQPLGVFYRMHSVAALMELLTSA